MICRNLNITNQVLESFAEVLEVNVLDLNYKKNFSEYSTLDSLGLVKLIITPRLRRMKSPVIMSSLKLPMQVRLLSILLGYI